MTVSFPLLKARLAGYVESSKQYIPFIMGGSLFWHLLLCCLLWRENGITLENILSDSVTLPMYWEYMPFIAIFSSFFTVILVFFCNLAREWQMSRLKQHYQYLLSVQENLSTIDELTGFLNYRGFLEQGKRELARALRSQNTTIGIIMVDIDNFRNFNLHYGSTTGDTVIEILSRHIRECFRLEDIYCRYDQDRFIILFTNVTRPILEQIAERLRIRCQTERIILSEDEHTGFTVSIGGAIIPDYCIENRNDIDARMKELIQLGTVALQTAKSAGRNCYYFFQN